MKCNSCEKTTTKKQGAVINCNECYVDILAKVYQTGVNDTLKHIAGIFKTMNESQIKLFIENVKSENSFDGKLEVQDIGKNNE